MKTTHCMETLPLLEPVPVYGAASVTADDHVAV
jgi:hypothetical protein